MFRILINSILIVALTCWPAFAQYYTGSAWTQTDCKYYNGSAWVDCSVNYYNGSTWDDITEGSSTGFTVTQGVYTGNAVDDRQITVSGLTSSSDAMVLIAHDNAQSGAFRFPAQSGDVSSEWADSQVEEADMIQAYGTDYFEVGTTYEVNNTNDYAYLVINNNNSTSVEFGTYTGNGVDGRTISLSTITGTPDLVVVKHAGASFGAFHTDAMGDSTDISAYFGVLAEASNRIQAVGAGSFEVSSSSTMNGSSETYYYAAFMHVSGAFITGSYTGDGNDDRSISGLGFQPDYVLVKSAGSTGAVIHTTGMGASTDESYYVPNTASVADAIQSLDSDGFEVGTSSSVNGSGTIYYYIAFKEGTHND